MGCFSLFIDIPAAMSCQRWHVRWRGIYGCAICFRPFLLTGKDQRVKADIKGLPHLATAPPPCRPGPRAQPGRCLAFPHTVSVVIASIPNDTLPPKTLIAGPDPRSPKPPEDYTPRRRFASSRGTKRSIYDRFM